MSSLIEFFQPIDEGGYQVIEISGFREGQSTKRNPVAAALLGLVPDHGSSFRTRDGARAFIVDLLRREVGGGLIAVGAGLNPSRIRRDEHTPEFKTLVEARMKQEFVPVTEKFVVGKTGGIVYRPAHADKEFQSAFMALAKAQKTEAGVLAFVNKFGLPAKSGMGDQFELDSNLEVIPLEVIFQIQKIFNSIIEHETTANDNNALLEMCAKNSKIAVSNKADNNASRLVIEPHTLLDFMIWQFTESSADGSDREYVHCKHCDLYFGRGQGTDRRLSAIYCSDRCKNSAQYYKKKERALNKAKGR